MAAEDGSLEQGLVLQDGLLAAVVAVHGYVSGQVPASWYRWAAVYEVAGDVTEGKHPPSNAATRVEGAHADHGFVTADVSQCRFMVTGSKGNRECYSVREAYIQVEECLQN